MAYPAKADLDMQHRTGANITAHTYTGIQQGICHLCLPNRQCRCLDMMFGIHNIKGNGRLKREANRQCHPGRTAEWPRMKPKSHVRSHRRHEPVIRKYTQERPGRRFYLSADQNRKLEIRQLCNKSVTELPEQADGTAEKMCGSTAPDQYFTEIYQERAAEKGRMFDKGSLNGG